MSKNKIIALSEGKHHTLALKANGKLMVWGYSWFGQCSIPPRLCNVTAIATGGDHSLALTSDGNVVAWVATTTAKL